MPVPVMMVMTVPMIIVVVVVVVVVVVWVIVRLTMGAAMMSRMRIMTRMMGMVAGRFGHGVAFGKSSPDRILYGIGARHANMKRFPGTLLLREFSFKEFHGVPSNYQVWRVFLLFYRKTFLEAIDYF